LEDLEKVLGARVRLRRELLDMHQGDLAKGAKLSRTAIVNIENGRTGTSLKRLILIARALKCDPGSLVKGF
jgi:transcriptional regulator with XRE-family HTH domain